MIIYFILHVFLYDFIKLIFIFIFIFIFYTLRQSYYDIYFIEIHFLYAKFLFENHSL